MTTRQVPPMAEYVLLATVVEMAARLGLRTAHFRPARTQTGEWKTAVQGDGKGYPDLTIVGPGGVLFRELKTDKGRLRPEQAAWLGWLTTAGADAAVWQPCDLSTGRIEKELRAVRRPHATTEVRHGLR